MLVRMIILKTVILFHTWTPSGLIAIKLSTKNQLHRQANHLSAKILNLRLLVRHRVVVKSCSFVSLVCRCTEETLSLGAQMFVDGWDI